MSDGVEILLNGSTHRVSAGTSVAKLLAELDLRQQHVAVEINQQLVPRGQHDARRLAAGDRIEIVTLVGGG